MDSGKILQLLSGKGLLEARAIWAALVGPHRLALARSKAVTLSTTQAVEIYKNLAAADAVVFVGVSLPAGAAGPIPVFFNASGEGGRNTGTPAALVSQMIGGTFINEGFTQILLPGDQLFGQLDPSAPAATQQVVVSAVVF